jgi:transcriptional regulator with XRE-family HTH domain
MAKGKVGANLKRIRESRGLSQTRLGGRAEINPATVNQIEMGSRNPSVATLERLAEVLGVPVAALFMEESSRPLAQAR